MVDLIEKKSQEEKQYEYIYGLVLGIVNDGESRLKVADRLRKIKEVGLCEATTDPYHFFCLIRGEAPSEIADINKKIHDTEGVHSTMVEIIAEDNLTPHNWFGKKIK